MLLHGLLSMLKSRLHRCNMKSYKHMQILSAVKEDLDLIIQQHQLLCDVIRKQVAEETQGVKSVSSASFTTVTLVKLQDN